MKPSKLSLHSWVAFPLLVVVLGASVFSAWVLTTHRARHAMKEASDNAHSALFAHIHDRTSLLTRINISTFHLARILGSNSSQMFTSFSSIENQVTHNFSTINPRFDGLCDPILATQIAPRLFLSFAMNSELSQISYIDRDGLLFSYYKEVSGTQVIFSNTSISWNASTKDHLYTQPVDENTGMKYGIITVLPLLVSNDLKWFRSVLDGQNGHASLGFGFGKTKDLLFYITAPLGKGVLLLGVSMKDFSEFISGVDLHGGHLYLATEDGHLLMQTGPPHVHYVVNNHTVSVHVIDNKDMASEEEFVNISCQIYSYVSVTPMDDKHLNVWGKTYTFGCTHLDAAGIRLVSIMAFPRKKTVRLFKKMNIIVVSLMALLIFVVIIGSSIILELFRRSQAKEIFLRANLIKQKEATQQAERKSMNKSLAFASASHDIRTSLAGITGLIDICHGNVLPGSELHKNLVQMNACALKLLGILNSVLDISKVEAGKMQLEEVEFDMAQVIEESTDIFHVVAFKKGLEMIWDPCDCSVLKLSNVKGDCRRFKQILDNLLGNAVKFTSKGRVVVRVWARRPCMKEFKLSSKHRRRFSNVLADLETVDPIQHDPTSIEFIFEVDDTGIGIPKEKRASVFENYVQVKESIVGGHEGTGLGLGIVQSYVRLMGGEISIKDKEPGDRGACFTFNIFLKSGGITSSVGAVDDGSSSNQGQNDLKKASSKNFSHVGQHMAYQSSIRAMAFEKGLKVEGIHALLLVQGEETRNILHKWLESLGVKVWTLHHLELLYPTHEKIMQRFQNNLSSSGKHDYGLLGIANRDKEKPTNCKDRNGNDQALPLAMRNPSKKHSRGSTPCLLVLLDVSCGSCSEMCSILRSFYENIHSVQYKFVWLTNLDTPIADVEKIKQAPHDLILQKPFHGSRLHATLRLLQDFGSVNEGQPSELQLESKEQGEQRSTKLSPSKLRIDRTRQREELSLQSGNSDNDKPLAGIKILLVEDTHVLRHLGSTMLSRLGASIDFAENGLDALNLVRKGLQEIANQAHDGSSKTQGISKYFPYNVILMDCEMPVMNGYEATRQIRMEEKCHGLHIPVIALTAHAAPEEEKKTKLSGMDFHLTKPLQTNMLVEVIRSVCRMKSCEEC